MRSSTVQRRVEGDPSNCRIPTMHIPVHGTSVSYPLHTQDRRMSEVTYIETTTTEIACMKKYKREHVIHNIWSSRRRDMESKQLELHGPWYLLFQSPMPSLLPQKPPQSTGIPHPRTPSSPTHPGTNAREDPHHQKPSETTDDSEVNGRRMRSDDSLTRDVFVHRKLTTRQT